MAACRKPQLLQIQCSRAPLRCPTICTTLIMTARGPSTTRRVQRGGALTHADPSSIRAGGHCLIPSALGVHCVLHAGAYVGCCMRLCQQHTHLPQSAQDRSFNPCGPSIEAGGQCELWLLWVCIVCVHCVLFKSQAQACTACVMITGHLCGIWHTHHLQSARYTSPLHFADGVCAK
jgi:hypothetical protein